MKTEVFDSNRSVNKDQVEKSFCKKNTTRTFVTLQAKIKKNLVTKNA